MKHFFYWLADRLRPWHDDGLGEELRLPDNSERYFIRGAMLRAAGLSMSQNMAFGAFQVLGLEHARRAAGAWRPRELHLMEDLSLAFYEVEDRAHKGIFVAPVHVSRLVEIVHHYLEYQGSPWTREAINSRVQY